MGIGRWITNLESRERLVAEKDAAQEAVTNDPEDPRAKALLHTALVALVNRDNTMDLIRQEHGEVVEGPPMATEYRTSEEIAADGYVGIYKRGAGRG